MQKQALGLNPSSCFSAGQCPAARSLVDSYRINSRGLCCNDPARRTTPPNTGNPRETLLIVLYIPSSTTTISDYAPLLACALSRLPLWLRRRKHCGQAPISDGRHFEYGPDSFEYYLPFKVKIAFLRQKKKFCHASVRVKWFTRPRGA